MPAPASPKSFASNQEKILYHLACAEYLSTPQLIQLVYSQLAGRAQAAAASRDLRKLLTSGRVHLHPLRIQKHRIYSASGTAKPSAHNLAVRDLYVKISRSEHEIADVVFSPKLPGLTPDLAVMFTACDGSTIKTLWEYDAGTEGVAEILDKVRRYEAYRTSHRISFIASDANRLSQFLAAIPDSWITFAELGAFTTITDAAFRQGGNADPGPFFRDSAGGPACPQ